MNSLSSSRAAVALALAAAIPAQDPAGKTWPRPEPIFEKPLTFSAPDRRAARRVLSTGAVAYLVADPAVPRVEVKIHARAGSYLDPPGKEGLGRLVALGLRGGGTAARSAAEFDRALAELGATLDVHVGDTEAFLLVRCDPSSMKQALTLAFELLQTPAFSEASLAQDRRRILESLTARDDDVRAIEERAWNRLTRGSHESTRLPNPTSLGRVTRQDLVQYAEQFFFARNLLLAVSGAFDESNIVPLLEESMAGLRNRDAPLPIPSEPREPAAPGVYFVDAGRPMATARVRVGFVGLRRDDPDRVPLQVLLEHVGGRVAPSRVERTLRAEGGLTWDPAATFAPGSFYAGSHCIHGTCLADDAGVLAQRMIAELKALRERTLPEDALAALRQMLVDRAAAAETSAAARAARFALDEIARADAEEASRDRARLEALTADECLRAARTWLDPAKAIVLVVGNARAANAVEAVFGPSRPVAGL